MGLPEFQIWKAIYAQWKTKIPVVQAKHSPGVIYVYLLDECSGPGHTPSDAPVKVYAS